MQETQTAVVLREYGSNLRELLQISDRFAIPALDRGQALVRVVCRSVNPADIGACQGMMPQYMNVAPTVPGFQGVGFVEDCGSGRFKKGQRVIAVPFPAEQQNGGSWQQYAAVPEDSLVALPSEVDDESASLLDINTMTARGMFDELQIPTGEWLLQSAAGSSLGRQIIQLARHYGIKTINVVRREEQKHELLQLGGDEVIVSTGHGGDDIVKQVTEITGGKGAYAVMDAVGGALTSQLLSATRASGRLLIYGFLSGVTFTGSIMDVLLQNKTVGGFSKTVWEERVGRDKYLAMLQELIELFVQKTLSTASGQSYTLEQAAEAVTEVQKGARGSKKVFLKG